MIDIEDFYSEGMSSQQLAQKVLDTAYGDNISFPINPFELIQLFGAQYRFMSFEDLDGVYIVPDDENDIAIIGIKHSTLITRQRFTAAHELCHHIKDQQSVTCPINGDNTPIERYANQFAASLLMPKCEMEKQIAKYEIEGKVSRNAAVYIAEYFGTSFESTVFELAYEYGVLDAGLSSDQIKQNNKAFGIEEKKKELNIDSCQLVLWEQIINSYFFALWDSTEHQRLVFKNKFVFNENKIENVNLPIEKVSEIVTDLRLYGQDSKYCSEENKEITQILGHATMYDYILSEDSERNLSVFKILTLHKLLYKYAPFPQFAGRFRSETAVISGAAVETADVGKISEKLSEIDDELKATLNQLDKFSVSEYIEFAARIHYRLTAIHPFDDGNGRCSRAFLNWMLKLKDLPPFYIKFPEKDEYISALELIDEKGYYDKLYVVIIKELLKSSIDLEKYN